MNADTSSNAMNHLYLNTDFFKVRAMQFFRLQLNITLILSVIIGASFFVSCSSSKKIAVAANNNAPVTDHKSKMAEKKVTDDESGASETEERDDKTKKKTKVNASEDKAEIVISTARTFIGTPYKYGGTTRSGMDCSALLINSFSVVKLNLPRSSEAQSKVGTEVKINELQPGDLVFFATGNKKKEITHVGLVTDVRAKDNIKFIHASSSLGVVETNLFAEYYQKRFRVARRVIE